MIRWESVSCPWHNGTRDALRTRVRWARKADRDDIAQSVAVAMLQRRARGLVDAQPAGLAATITTRMAARRWRERRAAPDSIDPDQLVAADPGLAALEVQDLLSCLPAAARRVAEQKVLCGQSLREIATQEGAPLARIQRLWQSAKALLARALGLGETGRRGDGETGRRGDGETGRRGAPRGPRFSRILIQSGGSRALEGWTRGALAHAA